MTSKEIELGKTLYFRVNSVYGIHPEYKKLNKGVDRFEKFVEEMTEKYNTSRANIIAQIRYTIGD